MAKNKTTTSKSPSKQKIQAGGSNKMHNFEGVGEQKPGGSAVSKKGTGGKFAKGGPSGKMTGNMAVQPQKPGGSAITNPHSSKSYAK
jgi:hypothetical protein